MNEAANGAEALAGWRVHGPKIDLSYTDMLRPGEMTGLQIADQILAEVPDTKVIITSGYNNALPEVGKPWGTSMVDLPKPCPPATLLSVLHECLRPK